MSAKAAAANRRLLGRYATVGTRDLVFETPEGIEIESREQYDVTRKRVLYEDVQLVTYHRETGAIYLVTTGILAAFFFVIAALAARNGKAESVVVAAVFAVLGTPFFFAFAVRLLFKVDVVTVFGRRSKAAMRFVFRKKKARQVYGSICARVRQVHRQLDQRYAAAAPAPPPPAEEQPPLPPTVVAE